MIKLKVMILAPHTIINVGPLPDSQILVANGQLIAPLATAEVQFEVGYFTFRQNCIAITNLASPLIGLLLLQRKITIVEMRQGIPIFPFPSMELKKEYWRYSNVNERVLNPVETIRQPHKRTTIWFNSRSYTDNEATSLIQPSRLPERDGDTISVQRFREH